MKNACSYSLQAFFLYPVAGKSNICYNDLQK